MNKYITRLQAVRESGLALVHIPKKERTYELCLEAVKRTGNALKFVPNEIVTEEICLIAIRTNGWAIQFIPEEFLTYEMCKEIIDRRFCVFGHVPEEFKRRFKNGNEELLSKREILEKYSIEELLTSDKPYLRKLGASNGKNL